MKEKDIIYYSFMKTIAPRLKNWALTNKFLKSASLKLLRKINAVLIFYNKDAHKSFRLIQMIDEDIGTYQSDVEIFNIINAIKAVKKITGDIAEVGVYKGSSAKAIAENEKAKKIHLFDTFNGLPASEAKFIKGDYASNFETVVRYMRTYKNVLFHAGRFPKDTGSQVDKSTFSFIHLDVDLYKSTLESLKFLYPKVTRGGIILIHDYLYPTRVKAAVTKFFADKPEVIFELPGSQCMIVKM